MYRQFVPGAVLLVSTLFAAFSAVAETVAVIGTGNVGAALGQRFGELGHRIVYGSREPDREDVERLVAATGPDASAATQEEAARDADIVVLAVPWDVVEDVTRALGDLTGRIVIDPTNPRSIAEDGLRDYAFDGSNAERIQALAPDASVVKAFSTLGAGTMLDPSIAGGPVSVPIAGDDAQAKAAVAELVAGIGLHPVDVGPLRYAHVIEGLHYLRYNAGQFGEARINFYLPADPN
ncbi:MAG: NADPH-dependent F420 reductase [Gammaproteobacteria bacterium]|nr:NADPH-dependent F420 reductase [Gammaproteobacteria bacterium]